MIVPRTSILFLLSITDNLTEALMFLSHFMGDLHQVCSLYWQLKNLKAVWRYKLCQQTNWICNEQYKFIFSRSVLVNLSLSLYIYIHIYIFFSFTNNLLQLTVEFHIWPLLADWISQSEREFYQKNVLNVLIEITIQMVCLRGLRDLCVKWNKQ